jgi:Arc/MetJ family transcription regulator
MARLLSPLPAGILLGDLVAEELSLAPSVDRDALPRMRVPDNVCGERHTVRTTLNLDDRALREAMAVADGSTKTEVVNEALRSFARGKRRKRLLELRGKVDWEGDIDQLRKRR